MKTRVVSAAAAAVFVAWRIAAAAAAGSVLKAPFDDGGGAAHHFQPPFGDARIEGRDGATVIQRGAGPDGGADWPFVEGVVHVSLADLPIVLIRAAGPASRGDRWVGSLVFFKGDESREFVKEVFFQTETARTDTLVLDARAWAGGDSDVVYYWVRLRPAYAGQGFLFDRIAVSDRRPGDGLRAEYFDDDNLTALKMTRIDPQVDFNWGQGSPDPSIGRDMFSVRWTGLVDVREAGDYTFFTVSDDGVRLWINGRLLINNWSDHGPVEDKGDIALEPGRHSIRLEYCEYGIDAVIRLLWAGARTPKQVVPQNRLFPPPAPAPRLEPSPGFFKKAVKVAAHGEDGVVVRYRTDGGEPQENDPALPPGQTLAVAETRVVTVKAWKEGWSPSAAVGGAYTIYRRAGELWKDFVRAGDEALEAKNYSEALLAYNDAVLLRPASLPRLEAKIKDCMAGQKAAAGLSGAVFEPAGGTHPAPLDVVIRCGEAADSLLYSTTGRDPLPGGPSLPCGEKVRLESSTTLKAQLWKDGIAQGPPRAAFYQIETVPSK